MSLPQLFERPLSIFDRFQDEDNFFNQFMGFPRTQDDNGDMAFLPPCDIKEGDSEFTVTVDLPGVEKKDINVDVKGGILQIDAESSSEKEEKKEGRVLRSERRHGKYIRRFNLGQNVDHSGAKASFDNGVLVINIPKKEGTEEESTKIAVK